MKKHIHYIWPWPLRSFGTFTIDLQFEHVISSCLHFLTCIWVNVIRSTGTCGRLAVGNIILPGRVLFKFLSGYTVALHLHRYQVLLFDNSCYYFLLYAHWAYYAIVSCYCANICPSYASVFQENILKCVVTTNVIDSHFQHLYARI